MAKTQEFLSFLDDRITIAPANTQEEYLAAQTIADVMTAHGVDVAVEEFDSPALGGIPQGLLQALVFIGAVLCGTGQNWSLPVGILLVLVGAVPLLMEASGHSVVRKLSGKAVSQNVVGFHAATGPAVIKGARPIVIVAHYDTPHESFLYGSQLSRYLALVRTYRLVLVRVVLAAIVVQALVFLPEALRILAWILGIVAALPLLLLGIGSIAEQLAPCTPGMNDNKSSVAAMLGVLADVHPSSWEPEITGRRAKAEAEAAAAAAAAEAEAAAAALEAAAQAIPPEEEVVGIRHGQHVIEELGLLPRTCEIEYVSTTLEPIPMTETDLFGYYDDSKYDHASDQFDEMVNQYADDIFNDAVASAEPEPAVVPESEIAPEPEVVPEPEPELEAEPEPEFEPEAEPELEPAEAEDEGVDPEFDFAPDADAEPEAEEEAPADFTPADDNEISFSVAPYTRDEPESKFAGLFEKASNVFHSFTSKVSSIVASAGEGLNNAGAALDGTPKPGEMPTPSSVGAFSYGFDPEAELIPVPEGGFEDEPEEIPAEDEPVFEAEDEPVFEPEALEDFVDDFAEEAEDVFEPVEEAVEEIVDEAEGVFEPVEEAAEEIIDEAEGVFEPVEEADEDIAEEAEDVFEPVEEAVEDIVEEVEEIEEAAEESAEEAVEDIAEEVEAAEDIVEETVEEIVDEAEAIEEVVEDVAEEVVEEVVEDIEDVTEAAEEAIEEVEDEFEDLDEAIEETLEDVEDVVEDAEEAVEEAVEDLGEDLAEEVEDVDEAIEEFAEEAEDVVEDIEDAIEDTVDEAVEDIEEAAEETIEDIEDEAEAVEEAVEDLGEDLAEEVEDVDEAIEEFAEEAEDVVEDIEDAIEDTVDEAVEDIEEAAEETIEDIEDEAEAVEEAVEDLGEDLAEEVEDVEETIEETADEVIDEAAEEIEDVEETVEEIEPEPESEPAEEEIPMATEYEPIVDEDAPASEEPETETESFTSRIGNAFKGFFGRARSAFAGNDVAETPADEPEEAPAEEIREFEPTIEAVDEALAAELVIEPEPEPEPEEILEDTAALKIVGFDEDDEIAPDEVEASPVFDRLAALRLVPSPEDESSTVAMTREELLRDNRFALDLVEGGNDDSSQDSAGLYNIGDSLDLTADVPANPEPVDDPTWGQSTYNPPKVDIGRRASLYDLPDPSESENDPFAFGSNSSNKKRLDENNGWKGGAALRVDLRDDEEYEKEDAAVEDEDAEVFGVPAEEELREAILTLGDDDLIAHDIWFVALGASGMDNAGMRAFLDEHRRDIRGAFLVNLDCVGAGELTLLTEEGEGKARHCDRRISRLLKNIANDLHASLKEMTHRWGDTDATPAMRKSVRAITIMGCDESGLPAYSRQAEDDLDKLDPQQIALVNDLVSELIRRS